MRGWPAGAGGSAMWGPVHPSEEVACATCDPLGWKKDQETTFMFLRVPIGPEARNPPLKNRHKLFGAKLTNTRPWRPHLLCPYLPDKRPETWRSCHSANVPDGWDSGSQKPVSGNLNGWSEIFAPKSGKTQVWFPVLGLLFGGPVPHGRQEGAPGVGALKPLLAVGEVGGNSLSKPRSWGSQVPGVPLAKACLGRALGVPRRLARNHTPVRAPGDAQGSSGRE